MQNFLLDGLLCVVAVGLWIAALLAAVVSVMDLSEVIFLKNQRKIYSATAWGVLAAILLFSPFRGVLELLSTPSTQYAVFWIFIVAVVWITAVSLFMLWWAHIQYRKEFPSQPQIETIETLIKKISRAKIINRMSWTIAVLGGLYIFFTDRPESLIYGILIVAIPFVGFVLGEYTSRYIKDKKQHLFYLKNFSDRNIEKK